MKKILVTGGAGYVGSALIPALLHAGYDVVVYDLYIYDKNIFSHLRSNPHLTEVVADLRDTEKFSQAVSGVDTVIHLACISNDPSFELNPDLGKSINYDCFRPMVIAAKKAGVKRFIYASSSSVYGIKDEPNVTEELALEPLTDYSKFKAMCEKDLIAERDPNLCSIIIRPATVCGYAPRLRLDLTVNILTNHAFNENKIRVFGGNQLRPNIHVDDMCDLYIKMIEAPKEIVDGKIYNAGYENQSVLSIAEIVKRNLEKNIEIVIEPTSDNRSYHINSSKVANEVGFKPKRTIDDAVCGLLNAFSQGRIPDSMSDSRYYNIKRMQEINLR